MTRWFNSLGQEVIIEEIDREYALNILTMVLLRCGRAGCDDQEVRQDPLVQRLRPVVLHGREPNEADAERGALYNKQNRRLGMPFRAPIRTPEQQETVDHFQDKYGDPA